LSSLGYLGQSHPTFGASRSFPLFHVFRWKYILSQIHPSLHHFLICFSVVASSDRPLLASGAQVKANDKEEDCQKKEYGR
jgi:hypothetical protein